MIRQQSVRWMTLVFVSLIGTSVAGQDEGAAELYGQGVHAYFAGDQDAAIALLSDSIDKYGSDPRAYYFRGLALASKLGLDAGLADLEKGADIEVNQADRPVYDINGALQRVQGTLRLELEKVRAATRKAAIARQRKRDRVRYEELKRREDIVLFDPKRPVKPDVKVDLPIPDLASQDDPFATGRAFSGGEKIDYVAPTPVEPSGDQGQPGAAQQPRDPFAEPGAPVDPFAEPAAKTPPAAPKPKEPAAEANPFGENMPTLEMQGIDSAPAPGANMGAGILDLLGKTLSGKASHRDPFGESPKPAPDEPAKEAAPTPPAKDTTNDPFAPAAKPAPGDEPAEEADEPPAQAPAEDGTGNAGPAEGGEPVEDPDK